jgi:hypothetical protein
MCRLCAGDTFRKVQGLYRSRWALSLYCFGCVIVAARSEMLGFCASRAFTKAHFTRTSESSKVIMLAIDLRAEMLSFCASHARYLLENVASANVVRALASVPQRGAGIHQTLSRDGSALRQMCPRTAIGEHLIVKPELRLARRHHVE